ncbi:hypothetical protein AVEN_54404-1 [Araneus ventricosus]|uniref:Uncharacterized protein n=1 Tax=Araneus ventricosus TaxID=182803 RepID=A0A4Y2D9D8_ARAVE|nr:hypothetical protein AVEN_54404-1 [Araneus ventricosus]
MAVMILALVWNLPIGWCFSHFQKSHFPHALKSLHGAYKTKGGFLHSQLPAPLIPEKTEVIVIGDQGKEHHHHHYHYHKHGHSHDHAHSQDHKLGHDHTYPHHQDHSFHHDPVFGNVRTQIHKSKFGILNNFFKPTSKHNSFNNGRVYYHPNKYQYNDRQGYDYDYHDGLEHFATNRQNYNNGYEHITDESRQLNAKSSLHQNTEGNSVNDHPAQNIMNSELRNDVTTTDIRHNTKFDDSASNNAGTASDDTDFSALSVTRDVLDTFKLLPVSGLKLSLGN